MGDPRQYVLKLAEIPAFDRVCQKIEALRGSVSDDLTCALSVLYPEIDGGSFWGNGTRIIFSCLFLSADKDLPIIVKKEDVKLL
jgi:hypothetical protein